VRTVTGPSAASAAPGALGLTKWQMGMPSLNEWRIMPQEWKPGQRIFAGSHFLTSAGTYREGAGLSTAAHVSCILRAHYEEYRWAANRGDATYSVETLSYRGDPRRPGSRLPNLQGSTWGHMTGTLFFNCSS
jgi:hypothetical protein